VFGANKPPVFDRTGKEEISLTMRAIKSWDDDGYGLSTSYFVDGEIEGGHSATIWGDADEYWRGGNQQRNSPKLRMNVKLSSDLSRKQFERGILGGGRFYENYVEVELNLEPDRVRDIVSELRLSYHRQLYVTGNSISAIIFRITMFGISEHRG